ncbi:MAG TPA: DUF1841 family protein [Longimicrobium sp.]|nr:DUF1841 family protein [Longimicrobium sp.]
MLTRYDPEHAPDPERWRAQNEMELVDIAMRYHKRERIPLVDPRAHAALHVMVENQVALGEATPVGDAVRRLMGEGMSRHDAIHAVGAVLDKHVFHAHTSGVPVSREAYYDDIRAVSVESWMAEFGPGRVDEAPADGGRGERDADEVRS